MKTLNEIDASLQMLLIGNQKCDAADIYDTDTDTDGVMIPVSTMLSRQHKNCLCSYSCHFVKILFFAPNSFMHIFSTFVCRHCGGKILD